MSQMQSQSQAQDAITRSPMEALLNKPMTPIQDRPSSEFVDLLQKPPRTMVEKTSALLRRAMERLRGRWVRGQFKAYGNVCVLGAIHEVDMSVPRDGHELATIQYSKAAQAVQRACNMSPDRYNDIVAWNENDILNKMEEAAKLCEAQGD